MESLEKIKEALKSLRQIEGVDACWIEAEEGDIVHVYTVTATANYDRDTRIFQEYAAIEQRFPEVSFEFLITSQSPVPGAEAVFSSHSSFPAADDVAPRT